MYGIHCISDFYLHTTVEVKAHKVEKSDQITGHDRLFKNLALPICQKHKEIGIDLGLEDIVLTNALETGTFAMLEGSKKAMKMLQLWRDSVDEDDFTYSRLAAALEKNGFVRLAHEYCYSDTGMGKHKYTLINS